MPTPDKELVQRLLARESYAMTLFCQDYRRGLYSVILRLVQNSESAEDILQESLLKVWQNIASYVPERGLLFSWAVKICQNAAIDHLRDRRTRFANRTQSLEDTPSVYHQVTSTDVTAHLDIVSLLRFLRPSYRQVMELLYLEQYTQVEVAEALQLPLGTVKTWSTQAKRLMATYVPAY